MIQVTFLDVDKTVTMTRGEFDKMFGVKEGVEILAGYDPSIFAIVVSSTVV
jgi:hypothetical protein